MGLVGETGAGKTTISWQFCSLLSERTARIPKGEIYFKGKNLLDLGEKRDAVDPGRGDIHDFSGPDDGA